MVEGSHRSAGVPSRAIESRLLLRSFPISHRMGTSSPVNQVTHQASSNHPLSMRGMSKTTCVAGQPNYPSSPWLPRQKASLSHRQQNRATSFRPSTTLLSHPTPTIVPAARAFSRQWIRLAGPRRLRGQRNPTISHAIHTQNPPPTTKATRCFHDRHVR